MMKLDDFEDVEEEIDFKEQEDIILAPLINQIDLISDAGIKNFVRSVLLKADAFWTAPVYPEPDIYNPDEYLEGGGVLNTQRVVRAIVLLCLANTIAHKEADILIAAGLIHSVTKAKFSEDDIVYDALYPYTLGAMVEVINSQDELYGDDTQSTTLDVDMEDVNMILSLVRRQQGPHSMIPETAPMPLSYENILFTAKLIAMQLHFIADGNERKLGRWILHEESGAK